MRRLVGVGLVLSVSACSQPLALSEASQEGFFTSWGVQLHYVLDLPQGAGPHPAVVLGHGSGPKTIDDLRGFAERLVDGGYAVLRFDKRGTGDSGGTYRQIGRDGSAAQVFPELAADLIAAVATAGRHPAVDSGRVGLMGESQAGWVVPLATAGNPAVAFTVLLSGPTVDVGLNIAFERLTQDQGYPLEAAYAHLDSTGYTPDWDPTPLLRGLATPGLWVLGSDDALVPTRYSVAVLETLAGEGFPFTVEVLASHDHALQPVGGADRIDYWPIVLEWLSAIGEEALP